MGPNLANSKRFREAGYQYCSCTSPSLLETSNLHPPLLSSPPIWRVLGVPFNFRTALAGFFILCKCVSSCLTSLREYFHPCQTYSNCFVCFFPLVFLSFPLYGGYWACRSIFGPHSQASSFCVSVYPLALLRYANTFILVKLTPIVLSVSFLLFFCLSL